MTMGFGGGFGSGGTGWGGSVMAALTGQQQQPQQPAGDWTGNPYSGGGGGGLDNPVLAALMGQTAQWRNRTSARAGMPAWGVDANGQPTWQGVQRTMARNVPGMGVMQVPVNQFGFTRTPMGSLAERLGGYTGGQAW